MTVIAFPRRLPGASGWRDDELRYLTTLTPAGSGLSWETGATERGDPQFYVIGPAPDHDCLLCVSRLADGYVLQDGAGRLIGEALSLDRFAVEAARAAMRGGRSFMARVTLLVCAIRLAIEEKVEPIFDETQELLVRFVPQVAALV
jgi:hypothetical protein